MQLADTIDEDQLEDLVEFQANRSSFENEFFTQFLDGHPMTGAVLYRRGPMNIQEPLYAAGVLRFSFLNPFQRAATFRNAMDKVLDQELESDFSGFRGNILLRARSWGQYRFMYDRRTASVIF